MRFNSGKCMLCVNWDAARPPAPAVETFCGIACCARHRDRIRDVLAEAQMKALRLKIRGHTYPDGHAELELHGQSVHD